MTSGVCMRDWVAPELLMGTKYDESSDIYSLDVFLTELDAAQMLCSDTKDERTCKEMRSLQVLQMVLEGAILLSFSAACPPHILDIGCRRPSHNAAERPSTRELVVVAAQPWHCVRERT
ncbi:TPA: hypothetical protein N0F65_010739 [Lagenidium giganteum]|uniref:Protein kinase domain-containing protein n=1 Tax=Lagenidium giganteum TaxID=4803 RepID=A0AAV2YT04_9STRA|nr:TPA: hypothetical protein N0F65_010739 [Lagenidium giganteum]